MKGKFTPLNKSYAIELAKKYNLVQGCFGSELGHFDDDTDLDVFSSVLSFGIDLMSANNHPLIDIMENKKGKCLICLYEAPYLSGEYGDLEGILPKKIETKIESIDVPRHRDCEWGEDMDVNLVTGQTITVKLSDLERGMCKAHYAYKYVENLFSHQCN